jgi:hypothetical protein
MNNVKIDGEKVYIPDVRPVSWDTGEMCEFAASLVSALGSLGEPVAYDYVMGTSGVAFRFTLNPGEWDFANCSIQNIAPDQYAPIRRAFEAVGYACQIFTPGGFEEDFARIKDSIDRGVPVPAFQIVGPSDCSLITGYDEGGQVLLGWSTYQNIPQDHNIPPDSTGYFRKPGWHENTTGYMLIGEKIAPPPLKTTYMEALRWGVSLMRMKSLGKKATGLEGLKVWADEMVDERYFPADNNDLLGWRYVSAAINMTMLRDHCTAEPFLQTALEAFPEFQPELGRTLDCYHEVKSIRAGMDAIMSDNFAEEALKAIALPDARRAYAGAILQVRDAEAEALYHIEQLLARYAG